MANDRDEIQAVQLAVAPMHATSLTNTRMLLVAWTVLSVVVLVSLLVEFSWFRLFLVLSCLGNVAFHWRSMRSKRGRSE
jgi:hypothetical protein